MLKDYPQTRFLKKYGHQNKDSEIKLAKLLSIANRNFIKGKGHLMMRRMTICQGRRDKNDALDYNPVGVTDALIYARNKVWEMFKNYYDTDKFKVFPEGAIIEL